MANRSSIYHRIREILETARAGVARTVNTTQVVANWLVGREIVEEEQKGKKRAGYGERLIADLSERLIADYGRGYAARNLASFREFYIEYPNLLEILHSPRAKLEGTGLVEILHASRAESVTSAQDESIHHSLRDKSKCPRKGYAQRSDSEHSSATLFSEISHAVRGKSWKPGLLNSNLSWTHYRTLLRLEKPEMRAFYEIEAIKNNWSARELELQINSLLYERLAHSRDKKGLMKLATKGQVIQKPADVFKDPMVIEFLGLPESPRLVETDLESALISNLQSFLLELGRGFAFVSRQKRITLDGDHFYIDLVFYHTILKCFVLLDLKTGKLTQQDLGQMQLYVNYFDRERRATGDNPTLGLILCTDKNDAVVRYTLGENQRKTIIASRYQLHLPTVGELKVELRRKLRELKA